MVRFSVIVPLEFHRDQIDLCLRRWVRGQDYSRDDYEVLAAVGAGALSPAHRTAIEAQLDRRDRLLVYPDRHDVGLCARAAFEARGELLFFTESHVLPEPDTLTRADQAMRARPDADGLSGRCDPIVHNRLSVAEAAMYQRDIRHGMEQHPWRRILDQCYVARREPYFRAGGFAAVYGHFAEWLLAARMHAAGMVVAYAPEVVLHHVYCGRVRELVAFARDFATGQVRYEAEATDEPCRALLDAVPEWDTSVGLGAARARAALRRSASLFSRSGAWNLAWWRWLVVALGRWWVRPWIRCGVAAVGVVAARIRVAVALEHCRDERSIQAALVSLNDAVVRHARWSYVARRGFGAHASAGRRPAPIRPDADWCADDASRAADATWHGVERGEDGAFRWSEPYAGVELAGPQGHYVVRIEGLSLRPGAWVEVALDGSSVFAGEFLDELSLSIELGPSGAGLDWVCQPWYGVGDSRPLGLAVRRITLRESSERQPGPGSGRG